MRILLTGASGQLGAYLLDRLAAEGHELLAWSGRQMGTRNGVEMTPVDLSDPRAIERGLQEADPGAVLHAAAISSAADAYRDPAYAEVVNIQATRTIAAWCRVRGRRLLYTSTDMVFDGSRPWNREDDPALPLTVYGRSKRNAEPAVVELPGGLVARLSLLYGPGRSGRVGFFDQAVADLRAGRLRIFFEDEYRTPLSYRDAAEILTRLLASDRVGIVHVGGTERLSRFDLMRRCASALGLDPTLVRANRLTEAPGPEPRPADVSLDTSRLADWLPDLRRSTPESLET